LKKGVDQKIFREVDLLLTAHLIKNMVDTYVLKRWDLRGRVSRIEMERSIIDLLSYGLLKDKRDKGSSSDNKKFLEGKIVLLINGEAPLSRFIVPFLENAGGKIFLEKESSDHPNGTIPANKFISYDATKTTSFFEEIERDVGRIDVVIHDLGVPSRKASSLEKRKKLLRQQLENNLSYAREIGDFLRETYSQKNIGTCLYLAPWGWDQLLDPLLYDTVKAGVIALTSSMARAMVPSRVNVNCIIPGFIDLETKGGMSIIGDEVTLPQTPWGRLGEVQDILECVKFFISDASRYVTGQALEVSC